MHSQSLFVDICICIYALFVSTSIMSFTAKGFVRKSTIELCIQSEASINHVPMRIKCPRRRTSQA